MCSRFELNHSAREVAARFGLVEPPPLPNQAEVRPTDRALVIAAGGRTWLLAWGLAVEWDKRPLINARAETLAERPTFRRLLGHRVLVPASCWFEWMPRPGAKAKTRMRIRPADHGPFALAGLVDNGRFTIVTCAARPDLAHIHSRMPVALPPDKEALWLDPATPIADLGAVLAPTDAPLEATADDTSPTAQGLFD
ncbi:SOS response-associated peptidase [Magnetospirillum sp. UT-4]|uniref:SOS response-associated peptidase n=1 Tax=Magnetospirillum sp. UT-4 TaxID=2681467 RepID=UPI00137F5C98|nr:SOS response-associated peptidase [Magnetospirillum sp. UT-4]CAA7627160.1 conserved hypothetical protein [Magnetospirillum sp. UT-4]